MNSIRRVARWVIKRLHPVSESQFSPVAWANLGFIGRWCVQLVSLRHKPVLIISFPRSGSSWLGKMLGATSEALYLREPINQSILSHTELSTLFEVDSADMQSNLRSFADDVFAGYPSFDRSIVAFPNQWSLVDRKTKRVVVKEVNPFAYPWLRNSYDFRTIYLVRHPAAVALSYHRLGWTGYELDDLPSIKEAISKRHLTNFWSYHGALQALASQVISNALERQDEENYRVVRYEELCKRPVHSFQALFRFAGFNWSQRDATRIRKHANSTNARRNSPYDIKRESARMVGAWHNGISEEELQFLRDAYLYYDPALYTDRW